VKFNFRAVGGRVTLAGGRPGVRRVIVRLCLSVNLGAYSYKSVPEATACSALQNAHVQIMTFMNITAAMYSSPQRWGGTPVPASSACISESGCPRGVNGS